MRTLFGRDTGNFRKVLEALSEALPMVSSYRTKVEEQEQKIVDVEKSLEEALADRGAFRSFTNYDDDEGEQDVARDINTVKAEMAETESRVLTKL